MGSIPNREGFGEVTQIPGGTPPAAAGGLSFSADLKTATFVTAKGIMYLYDGSVTMTAHLPGAPVDGDIVGFQEATFGSTGTLTIDALSPIVIGYNIAAGSILQRGAGAALIFKYSALEDKWFPIYGSDGATLAQTPNSVVFSEANGVPINTQLSAGAPFLAFRGGASPLGLGNASPAQVLLFLAAYSPANQVMAATPQNNLAPSSAAAWRRATFATLASSVAEIEITGLDASGAALDDFVPLKRLYNTTGGFRWIVTAEDARSTAANRLTMPGNAAGQFYVPPGRFVDVWYNPTAARWQVIGNDSNFPSVNEHTYVTADSPASATMQNEISLVDPTGGAMQMAPRSNPMKGQVWGWKNITASANVITISGNGKNIEDPATHTLGATYTSNTPRAGHLYIYDGTQWQLAPGSV